MLVSAACLRVATARRSPTSPDGLPYAQAEVAQLAKSLAEPPPRTSASPNSSRPVCMTCVNLVSNLIFNRAGGAAKPLDVCNISFRSVNWMTIPSMNHSARCQT